MMAALPARILGMDFSGGKEAGKKLWISECRRQGDQLVLERCYRGRELPGSGAKREKCMMALRDFLRRESACLIGMDFPFGLHERMVPEDDWSAFIASFRKKFPTVESFRSYCRSFSARPELKRTSDIESKAPFAPYNLWIYRQTYYGIFDVLAPLLKEGVITALPMQSSISSGVQVMETCPASVLKWADLYLRYKGKAESALQNRAEIVNYLMEKKVKLATPNLRQVLLDDPEGDALDSLLSAFIVFKNMQSPENLYRMDKAEYVREGVVFF